MKIYIAGKITGDKDYAAKFAEAQDEMEAQGHIVLNPAELPEGMSSADYMRICFAMIDCADVVLFLPDWRESKGAQLERSYCMYIGKQIMEWEETLITNADRIRAMSDEELAKFIPGWSCTGACKCDEQPYVDCNNECEKCVLEWLKQHAEED